MDAIIVIESTMADQKLLLSAYDEEVLYRKLRDYRLMRRASSAAASDHEKRVNRLHRKLEVRRLQRKNAAIGKCFDLRREAAKLGFVSEAADVETTKLVKPEGDEGNVLDRFQRVASSSASATASAVGVAESCSFESAATILSPYTGRRLKPFIRRDFGVRPPRLRLHDELLRRTKSVRQSSPASSSIDYCYIRPQLVAPVNRLARHFFWPGIDVSESLQYPDFTVVALFRKVVVGFAFLLPHCSANRPTEAYISFFFTHPDWRRAGIATFMLYHLIQVRCSSTIMKYLFHGRIT